MPRLTEYLLRQPLLRAVDELPPVARDSVLRLRRILRKSDGGSALEGDLVEDALVTTRLVLDDETRSELSNDLLHVETIVEQFVEFR
mgnify:CR=1 FL=1